MKKKAAKLRLCKHFLRKPNLGVQTRELSKVIREGL